MRMTFLLHASGSLLGVPIRVCSTGLHDSSRALKGPSCRPQAGDLWNTEEACYEDEGPDSQANMMPGIEDHHRADLDKESNRLFLDYSYL